MESPLCKIVNLYPPTHCDHFFGWSSDLLATSNWRIIMLLLLLLLLLLLVVVVVVVLVVVLLLLLLLLLSCWFLLSEFNSSGPKCQDRSPFKKAPFWLLKSFRVVVLQGFGVASVQPKPWFRIKASFPNCPFRLVNCWWFMVGEFHFCSFSLKGSWSHDPLKISKNHIMLSASSRLALIFHRRKFK